MNRGERGKKEWEWDFPRMSSRQWCSSFKNPRIVRVSRTFGGKDRHSKVCTVRGLRDRRIRLSVPTAIQLYDLQHKLGLTQPSKVVDWLIDASKHEIDKLPPLPIIPSHLLPTSHHDAFPGSPLPSPSPLPYNNNPNFFHWDPSLSQFGGPSHPQHSTYNFTPSPYIPQPENDYFLHQNSLFPTTLHFITRKQE